MLKDMEQRSEQSYLWIKQSGVVSDVVLVTIQSIVWSVWNMKVYVWQAKFYKSSHQAAPNENALHFLRLWKKEKHKLIGIPTTSIKSITSPVIAITNRES